MKWEEIRQAYPHQWLKLNILESHVDGNKKVIDDMEIINAIGCNSEAGRELGKCRGNEAVYHTFNEKIYYRIKNIFGFRMAK
ncbi:MAG TPA: hypothetical protein VIK78_06935 [Ruminiclostridium sp.]